MKYTIAFVVISICLYSYGQCPVLTAETVDDMSYGSQLDTDEMCNSTRKRVEAMKCGCKTGTLNLPSGPVKMGSREAAQLAQQINSTMDLALCRDLRDGARVSSCKTAKSDDNPDGDEEGSSIEAEQSGPTDEERLERLHQGLQVGISSLENSQRKVDKLQSDFDEIKELKDDHIADLSVEAQQKLQYDVDEDLDELFEDGPSKEKIEELKELLKQNEELNGEENSFLDPWVENEPLKYAYLRGEEDHRMDDLCENTSVKDAFFSNISNTPINYDDITSREDMFTNYWGDNLKEFFLTKLNVTAKFRKLYAIYDDYSDAIGRVVQTRDNIESLHKGIFDAIEKGLTGGPEALENWLSNNKNQINTWMDNRVAGQGFKIDEISNVYEQHDIYMEDIKGVDCDEVPRSLISVAAGAGKVVDLSLRAKRYLWNLF